MAGRKTGRSLEGPRIIAARSGPDGLSTMPSYADLLTLQEWIDLVAYLKSLAGDGGDPGRAH